MDFSQESGKPEDTLMIDNKIEEKSKKEEITTSYKGSWFSIDYPSSFKTDPVVLTENSGKDYV